MEKRTARVVLVLGSLGAVFYVLSSMVGRHYYRMIYGICLRDGPFAGPLCESWTFQAIFEVLAILAVAIGLWIYNEHRAV
jgi:hypothetical protein